jgi:hypothetical protein
MAVGHMYTREDKGPHPDMQGVTIMTDPQERRCEGEEVHAGLEEVRMDVEPCGTLEFRDSGGDDDSDDSAYDRAPDSDVDLDGEGHHDPVEDGIPDVQEPEDSDQGDDIYM